MRRFAELCEAVAATTKKNEKVRLVADYVRSAPLDDAAHAVVFLCGLTFPRYEEKTVGVGGRLIADVVAKIADAGGDAMMHAYRNHGDLGGMTDELLRESTANADTIVIPPVLSEVEGNEASNPSSSMPGKEGSLAALGMTNKDRITLHELAATFEKFAGMRQATQRAALLESLLRCASPVEAKYIVKILTGDMRIGLKESLVEEAIARAFEKPPAAVQRANMLTGDISATLRLAASGELESARMRLLHPLGFMLASPVENAEEAMEYMPGGALIEDKFDGIRAQAHKSGSQVRMFSRTLDEITEFPELNAVLAGVEGDFILDGEIIGWSAESARALPFTELQKRLGRKQPSLLMQQEIPVVYVAFDALYLDGELLMDQPLDARRKRLSAFVGAGLTPPSSSASGSGETSLAPTPPLQLASAILCTEAAELERAFTAALERGNEGLMIKSPQSVYAPGRRGKAWLKLKRPFATLDVVVTAVEYGHGKRHKVLSDYTFSVRDDSVPEAEKLVTIGKAYSGLTDAEILELTEFFLRHTVEDQGWRRIVEPRVVIEVAFNNIQKSRRHDSGYALRFPRIVRLRPDKPVSEIDTLSTVRALFERQSQGGAANAAGEQ